MLTSRLARACEEPDATKRTTSADALVGSRTGREGRRFALPDYGAMGRRGGAWDGSATAAAGHLELQLFYRLTSNKPTSFGSSFLGCCLCLGRFHPLEIKILIETSP